VGARPRPWPFEPQGALATCSGGLVPQAAAWCLLAGTEHLSFAMALAGAFATCSGGLMQQAAARCFLAGAKHGASFVRHGTGRCLCHLQWRAYAAGSGSVLSRWHGASFVRHGTGRCLCRVAATEQRAPGRALCTPRPCASPARRCAVPSLPQPS